MSDARTFKSENELTQIIIGHLEAIDDGLQDVTIDDAAGGSNEFDVLITIRKKERRFTVKVEETTDKF